MTKNKSNLHRVTAKDYDPGKHRQYAEMQKGSRVMPGLNLTQKELMARHVQGMSATELFTSKFNNYDQETANLLRELNSLDRIEQKLAYRAAIQSHSKGLEGLEEIREWAQNRREQFERERRAEFTSTEQARGGQASSDD